MHDVPDSRTRTDWPANPGLNATQGTALIHHRFADYGLVEGELPRRPNGVLVSNVAGGPWRTLWPDCRNGPTCSFRPGDDIYEGMIVGENSRENDLTVNPAKEKKLTNIRAAGSDETFC